MAPGVMMSSHISPIVECCVRIIQSVHSTHELIIAAAALIIADAEASYRFHDRKASASQDVLLAFLEEGEKRTDSLSAAYALFESDPTGGRAALLQQVLATQQWLTQW
jgi:hypothetical protein